MQKSVALILLLISCGCAHHPRKNLAEDRAPAAEQVDILNSIRKFFPTNASQYFMKGNTKIKIGQSYVTADCSVEIRDASRDNQNPLNYIRISGKFPRTDDLRRRAPFPEHFSLGASIGADVNNVKLSPVESNAIDFETVRSSDWGGEVKERVIIEHAPNSNDFYIRFITKPLTFGFSLPFDGTDMTCYNLTPAS